VLKYYRKGINYEMTKAAVAKARSAGLDVVGSFIFGAPIETLADMRETVSKAAALDLDFAQFNILRLVRGMPLWDELSQQGLIDDKSQWEGSVLGLQIHPQLTLKDSPLMLKEFHRAFYRRRKYITRQVARTLLRRKKQVFLNLSHPRELWSELRDTLYFGNEVEAN
jgi:anaerobic magnesium-protoporphyrin IX monomethyl ester cyclase